MPSSDNEFENVPKEDSDRELSHLPQEFRDRVEKEKAALRIAEEREVGEPGRKVPEGAGFGPDTPFGPLFPRSSQPGPPKLDRDELSRVEHGERLIKDGYVFWNTFDDDALSNLLNSQPIADYEREHADEGVASQPPEEAAIDEALMAIGVVATPEHREQMRVYLAAFRIFVERNARHRAGWRTGGVQGLMVDIRKKSDRAWNEFVMAAQRPSDVDSLLDLINYSAFAVQAVNEEQRTHRKVGAWDWPEGSR